MQIRTMLDAALDGQDWQTAAQCILASDASQQFSQEFVYPLAQIGFKVDLGYPVKNQAQFVCGVARVIEGMEAFNARKS